ncbi:MAG: isoprenylcysteine carboxylmethyltransferase family protein [Candidatus Bathyarchaeia archaeon]
MRNTRKEDWGFVVPATFVWVSSLAVTVWEFMILQGIKFYVTMVTMVGLFLFLSGVVIAWKAKMTLGENYFRTLRIRENHQLIKQGIYKRIRHPIYLGAIMYTMGIPLFLSSLYGSIIMLGLIPCTIYRIKLEERMLIEKFGDEYREYISKTKKLIPFVY